MQYKPNHSESIVYYVVAAVSIFVLISYGSAGDIPPIAGFLITGMSVYILYPNETIALIMALIVSTILRRTRLEGMENQPEEPKKEPKKPKKFKLEDIQNKLKNMTSDPQKPKKQGFTALAPSEYSDAPQEATVAPSPPSTQDMDKLSGMIDKTMKLIEMLPDGFLQNATNNNQ
jgi:hypothetical protein